MGRGASGWARLLRDVKGATGHRAQGSAWRPGLEMGTWDSQHACDDERAPGTGGQDLEKSLPGGLGRTGCSEWEREGMKKQKA